MNKRTRRLSPSAFHQGNVHGCFSTNPDLLIQHPPRNTKLEILTRWLTLLLAKTFYDGLVMQIDQQKCVACGNCIPICPMGAIAIDPARNRASVNADEC